MRFSDYEREAKKTDQHKPRRGRLDLNIPLMGIVGEAGTLHTEYKKLLRDGKAHRLFREHFKEELGDILWYISNIASRLGLSLDEIAKFNIAKIRDRWQIDPATRSVTLLFDSRYRRDEQLPRKMTVVFEETTNGKVKMSVNEVYVGDPLSDNAHYDDGYRYHDAFHLAYAAILGWSPVIRSLHKRKRKSNPRVDDVEDGGRAIVIEEGISAFVYNHAKDLDFYDGVHHVDYYVLKTIRDLVSGLEVGKCTSAQWEQAILNGYRIFRLLRKHKGGKVTIDLKDRTIKYSR